MSFFHRKARGEPVKGRLATPDDAPSLSRLVHNADRRFLTTSGGELPELFRVDPTAVLESDGRVIGVISFGWRAAPVAWLRTLLLQGQISTIAALRELSGPINAALAEQGISLAAVTVD